ncbi:hybrid sensor histidine kinase/response regulator [Natronosalvus amylolyticus]|uniref:hybrid sensor histidine kinase/response regulator n=1 Tax=Natronosalvus amylolyticus TaxID=2961994 RepID=UPI0020C9C1E8|nr:response regulator [Natronosalvus amylolyticus]
MGSDINVLYVNDNTELLELVSNRLEREEGRLDVDTAESVEQAMEVFQSDSVDCVLSDYHMPQQTGLDFLRLVRAEDAELPFILFTETGSETVASDSISAGVTDYVIKQTIGDPSELLAQKIVSYVDSRREKQRLERMDKQLRELTESTDDVLWIFSPDWEEIHFVNSSYETVFGQSVESVKANPQSFLDPVHDEDRDRVIQTMRRVSNGESVQIEYRVNKSEAIQLWVESRCRPMRDDHGEIDFITGFTRDITEEKHHEESLVLKNEQLESFAATVAHDLRNPLNVADGNIDLAREQVDSPYLETSAEAIAEMAVLIDELLTLAKKGATIDEQSRVSFDELLQISSNNIEMTDATLVIEGSAVIQCDPARTREALENLLRNALEHAGTSVTITAGILGQGDGFYVEDDGPGIPPEAREKVFDRGHTTAAAGTGFGLAIVEQIVVAHGWEIGVTESATGGARFEITGVSVLE